MKTEPTKCFFIAGNPVLHSLSPVVFSAYAGHTGIQHHYLKAHCRSAADVKILLDNGFSGGNITAPLKEEVLSLGFKQSEAVRMINSANTIYEKNGDLAFENTDINGVRNALRTVIPDPNGLKAVVVGIGGAGRAAVFALLEGGCEVVILNRNIENAQKWAAKFRCGAASLYQPGNAVRKAHIIVNTIGETESFASEILQHHVILDADYKTRPLKTRAEQIGATYISGEEWLIFQAIPAFKLFCGHETRHELLRDALMKREFRQSGNVVLIGMMKSGKSTVGRILSAQTGRRFADTDALVEQKIGKSISEIFSEDGEERFRHIEHEVFTECMKSDNQIIAAGGGLVIDSRNRDLILQSSFGVWLFASPEKLASRKDDDYRPLLKEGNSKDVLKKILKDRFSAYVQSSHVILPVEHDNEEEVVSVLLSLL